jgi:hypothetical protein
MNGIEKQAAFYRGYLPDDRSLVPLTIVLATSVALWLIVYVAGALAGVPQNEGAAFADSACHLRDPRVADSLPHAPRLPLCRETAESPAGAMPRLDLKATTRRQHG